MVKKKVALITGASSGIGYELAKFFAHDGYQLILVARRLDLLEKLKQEILILGKKNEIYLIQKDLSKMSAAEEIFHESQIFLNSSAPADHNLADGNLHLTSTIDVLVNNAGVGDYGSFIETSWEKESQMIFLNVYTLTYLSKLFIPGMIKSGSGSLLNIASTASFLSGPLMSVYYATKAYVLSFSEALSRELRGTGVTVTTFCPGPTLSGFQKEAGISGLKWFKDPKLPTALDAARCGYDAVKNKKSLVIHGFLNQFMVQGLRFLPRKFVTYFVYKIHSG